MTFVDALVLGIIEGITEFLPVSSTGHLILASSLLGLPETEFLKSFEIIIQFGAICAVIALYWKDLLSLPLIKKLMAGFIPTGILGFTLYPIIKTHLLGNEAVVLIALLVGGVALIGFEYFHKEKEGESGLEAISYKQSALIGLFQSVAMIPGVSRSAATIVGGLSLGLSRKTIVEFSFLLAVPTMLAATVLDLSESAHLFTKDQMGVLAVGFVVSFIVALGSIKFLLRFVRQHTFIPFGIYRIAVALLFWVVLLT
jgi:undecaprenyl-diphosphatase